MAFCFGRCKTRGKPEMKCGKGVHEELEHERSSILVLCQISKFDSAQSLREYLY